MSRTTYTLAVLALILLCILAACAHFPVHPGECPFVSQGGYGLEHVLQAEDPACKMRCLQELSNNCHLFGPELPQ
jgi:hypothetical protein